MNGICALKDNLSNYLFNDEQKYQKVFFIFKMIRHENQTNRGSIVL